MGNTQIATINVNGIRAAFRKGMEQWLEQSGVDLVLMQEVRADCETTKKLFGTDWELAVNASALKGRAGVAVAVRNSSGWKITDSHADQVTVEAASDGGRWLEVDLEKDGQPIRLVSAYLHSGEVGTEKQTLKMAHLERTSKRLIELLDPVQTDYSEKTLFAGDFNVVHTELDIKNWKPNHNKRAGVLDEEIAFLDNWAELGWVDTVRVATGKVAGPYSWWSWRGKAFDNNAGWRIDYQLASPSLAKKVKEVRVDKATDYASRFSDHAPVVVTYEI